MNSKPDLGWLIVLGAGIFLIFAKASFDAAWELPKKPVTPNFPPVPDVKGS